jgi:4,5-DOPA dioxygenase extradiol
MKEVGMPQFEPGGSKMPLLFIGHGNPMNAIQENDFSRAWAAMGAALPKPDAVLCISAHWETSGTRLTAMLTPQTLYDFSGFPKELYEQRYPAPGSPALARLIQERFTQTRLHLDHNWGLDHGAWSVLKHLFPAADVPVVQLSLDFSLKPPDHYRLAAGLKWLRDHKVLILGSGNMVHNLRTIAWQASAYDWASAFDQRLKHLIQTGDHDTLILYEKIGEAAHLAIPTNEHYLPLLYILALQEPGESIRFFAEQVTLGSISMRSVRIG